MNDIEFCRWEGDCFGFGYGTGESFVIEALCDAMKVIPLEGAYNHEDIQREVGGKVCWLLINALCKYPGDKRLAKDSIIEYGTSPRFGFLSSFGRELKEFMEGKTAGQLVDILDNYDATEDPVYQVEPTEEA